MFEKHKKLIFSQIAAVAAVVAFGAAIVRHQQTGLWREPTTGYFLLFGVLLLGTEVKLILDWLKIQKAAKTAQTPTEQ